MKYIEIKAPAKINIGLFITSKRIDGYHNLNTLFYPISDLFDVLTFESSAKFEFLCEDTSIPCDENNLVVKAVRVMEKIKGTPINVKIKLIKKIPSQAGLGGGSSDAAAALISLNEMAKMNLNFDQLVDVALRLGSDVPFFIKAKPAIGKSRGELLEFVDLDITQPILIVNPRISISTKEAFQNIIPEETGFDFKSAIINGKLVFSVLRKNVFNDFEESIFRNHDEIKVIKETMYINGAEYSLMSGSGSTVFGIFPDMESAEKTKSLMPKKYICSINNLD
jgi:4-diphosphocytidyl-2-C-methyl-D-erythritol kinase